MASYAYKPQKLDNILENFNGLREYLYEIDPQFDDERETLKRFMEHCNGETDDVFAGYNDMDLNRTKKAEGKRTLETRFEPDVF